MQATLGMRKLAVAALRAAAGGVDSDLRPTGASGPAVP